MPNLNNTETKKNLMRAFAGESQARNRYDFAAKIACKQKLHIIETVFKFTAQQEMAHAKIFYEHLKECEGENIKIDGAYPINISNNVEELLRAAVHNEKEETEIVYKDFAKKAEEEGFTAIANSFKLIGEIEKGHQTRFQTMLTAMENNTLFKVNTEVEWACLHCGHVHHGKEAPTVCPVCSHNQGFFKNFDLKLQ